MQPIELRRRRDRVRVNIGQQTGADHAVRRRILSCDRDGGARRRIRVCEQIIGIWTCRLELLVVFAQFFATQIQLENDLGELVEFTLEFHDVFLNDGLLSFKNTFLNEKKQETPSRTQTSRAHSVHCV